MSKKPTKAELIQTWHEADQSWTAVSSTHYSQEPVLPAYLARNSGVLYRPNNAGLLEPQGNFSHLPQKGLRFSQTGGHILAHAVDIRSNARTRAKEEPLREESTLHLLWDAEGTIPCPARFETEGRISFHVLFPLPDGGLLVYLHGVHYAPSGTLNQLARYDASGAVLWTRELDFADVPLFCPGGIWLKVLTQANGPGRFTFLDWDGQTRSQFRTSEPYCRNVVLPERSDDLWIVTQDASSTYQLVRFDTAGQELARVPLPDGRMNLYPAGDLLLCAGGGQLLLLERDTLQVRASFADPQPLFFLGRDCLGRFWLQGRSALCYDSSLNLISSHRLKGSTLGGYLDGDARLCAVTYQAKEELVRVFRLF